MNLAALIKNNLNNAETASTENMFIDRPIVTSSTEKSSESDEVETEQIIDTDKSTLTDLIPQFTDFKSLVNSNSDNLRYTKCLPVDSIEGVMLSDGIVFLKPVGEENKIIQLYKNMHKFHVPDLRVEYLKLCGENGYLIKYQNDGDYHWRVYNLKTTAYMVLFCRVDDDHIPIYINRYLRSMKPKFVFSNDYILLNPTMISDKINDNTDFNPEKYCEYYPRLYKRMSELTSKKVTFDIYQGALKKYIDVVHTITIINAMLKSL